MDFVKLKQYRNSKSPFARKLGIEVEAIGPGYARAVKRIREDDLSPVDTVHGGIPFALAETCSSAVASSHGYHFVTVSADFHYLRACRVGDTLTAEAREIERGQLFYLCEVRMLDQRGQMVGSGSFTYFLTEQRIEL